MSLPVRLKNFLDKNKIKYQPIEHRKVFTAIDSAETQHLDPKLIVKTMVIKADNNYLLALLPASKNTDKNKLKQAVNKWAGFKKSVKSVSWAKEAWMKKNMLGKVGATPPFGSLVKLPVFMDSTLFKAPNMIVNGGEYTESIKIKTKDFIKLESPIKASFSMKK